MNKLEQRSDWSVGKLNLFQNSPPRANIIFHRHGAQIGELDLEANPPTFTGDVDESAKVFFDAVIKQIVDYKSNQK